MAKSKLRLPAALQAFIDEGKTTFYCEDGEWDLHILPRDISPFRNHLPAGSIILAENGSGDCLFLKTGRSGTIEPKVFVFWHEEDRAEVFSTRLNDLTSSRPGVQPPAPSSSGPAMSPRDLEIALASTKDGKPEEAMERFENGSFGPDSLPVLRKLLSHPSITLVLAAIRCIGKLGPDILASPAAQEELTESRLDLESQLYQTGNRVWEHSGYPNCYSECLNTLLKLEADPEFIIEYVRDHIGLGNPDDLLASLNALKTIGTSDAISILKRAATFWLPDLNAKYAKQVKSIAASAKVTSR